MWQGLWIGFGDLRFFLQLEEWVAVQGGIIFVVGLELLVLGLVVFVHGLALLVLRVGAALTVTCGCNEIPPTLKMILRRGGGLPPKKLPENDPKK